MKRLQGTHERRSLPALFRFTLPVTLILALAASLLLPACPEPPAAGNPPGGKRPAPQQEGWSDTVAAAARRAMVERQLRSRDISDTRVLEVMGRIPRHRFLPHYSPWAYDDTPLPIGCGQTISQPYIVALMTQSLGVAPDDRVLEIGTGSGYQAAVLSGLARSVHTIEIIPELARRAKTVIETLGLKNVSVRCGDGYQGWPEAAPFDAVMVTARAGRIPPPLLEQLKVGGRLIMPLGDTGMVQELTLVTKTATGLTRRNICAVRFVPMTGEIER